MEVGSGRRVDQLEHGAVGQRLAPELPVVTTQRRAECVGIASGTGVRAEVERDVYCFRAAHLTATKAGERRCLVRLAAWRVLYSIEQPRER